MHVEIKDVILMNFTGSSTPDTGIFTFNNYPLTYTEVTGIHVSDSVLLKSPIIENFVPIESFLLQNLTLSNVSTTSGESIIVLSNIKHTEFSNFTFMSVFNSDSDNEGSAIIKITSIDLDSEYDTEIIKVIHWLFLMCFRM